MQPYNCGSEGMAVPRDLDDLDLGLLAALSEDPALTNSELAARLFSTESTVRRRRQALVKAGVYREGILVNPGALGYAILAMIGLQVEYSRMAEVQEALIRLPELRFIGRTLGRYDLLAEGWFRSREELLEFITATIGGIPGVIRAETFEMLKWVKATYDWSQTTGDIARIREVRDRTRREEEEP
jgi:Lrp/AsnC family transcriptional regulator, regulator for asnA, asnC and gidA